LPPSVLSFIAAAVFYLHFPRIPDQIPYNYEMPETKSLPDESFLEIRWRCLSLAADLDRLERAKVAVSDPRLVKLREALAVLLQDGPNRAERVQMILSDKSPAPAYGKSSKK
jgi:hypothetical protein